MWVANKYWHEYEKGKVTTILTILLLQKYLVLPWAAKVSET